MRFSLIALVAAASSVSAFTCSGNTDLHPYCCQSASNYPRGYVGSNCANATATASKCANKPADYSCPNQAQSVSICCQKLEALGTNPQPVAYYCGQPIGIKN